MDLLLLGLSHHTASVDVRARMSASVTDVPRWLDAAVELPSVSEVVIVSTCHRLEVYVATLDAEAALGEVKSLLLRDHPAWTHEAAFVVKRGFDAALHLCRVAAGLDSLIVGEAEVAGQVRRAAAVARESGTLGPYLERLVAGALAASGRARSETKIGEGVFSAASAGVAVAARALGPLADRRVLVVGAGQAGRSVIARLARKKVGGLVVASRSLRHAEEAAREASADVCPLDRLEDALATVDAVIAAMPCERWVVTAAAVGRVHELSAAGPSVFVDLSMPRVLEPAIAGVPGVTLYSVDDLGDIARRSLRRREREVPAAESIAHAEALRAYARVEDRRRYDASPRL